MEIKNSIKSLFSKDRIHKSDFFVIVPSDNCQVLQVVDKKFLKFMLWYGLTIQEIDNYGFSDNLGWHIGADDKVYVKRQLNGKGIFYYEEDLCEDKCKPLMKALSEMYNNINNDNLKKEKEEIKRCFKKCNIEKIYPYTGKELKTQEELSR